MARPRRPLSPAAQAARAQRQAAQAAARNASVYWQQQAKKQKAPAAPAPGGQGTAPPDTAAEPAAPVFNQSWYDNWLNNNQGYQGVLSSIAGQRTADIGNSSAQIARALGLFGGNVSDLQAQLQGALGATGQYGQDFLKSIFADANGDGIPDVQAAAADADKGGVSTLAQLGKAWQDRQAELEAGLNSRGIYRSGETGFQSNANNEQRAQEDYTARQQLVDYLTGISQAFASNEAQRGAAQNQAATDAYNWYMDNPDQWAAPPADPAAAPPAAEPAAPAAPPAPNTAAALVDQPGEIGEPARRQRDAYRAQIIAWHTQGKGWDWIKRQPEFAKWKALGGR